MMNLSSVSIDEFRANLASFIGRVMYGNDKIVIKKYNKEAAVLLSADEYEKLLDPTKRLSKDEWDKTVLELEDLTKDVPPVKPAVLEREIAKAIREVRAEKRHKKS